MAEQGKFDVRDLPITLHAMISELQRERDTRGNVYPRLISQHKLTQAVADHRNRVLDAAIVELKKVRDETGRQ